MNEPTISFSIREDKDGYVYMLHFMEDIGTLISDRKVQVGKRMTRVYYHLEPAGERRLRELLYEYEQVTTGVFRIAKEVDADDEEASYPVVSPAGADGAASKIQRSEAAVRRVDHGALPHSAGHAGFGAGVRQWQHVEAAGYVSAG